MRTSEQLHEALLEALSQTEPRAPEPAPGQRPVEGVTWRDLDAHLPPVVSHGSYQHATFAETLARSGSPGLAVTWQVFREITTLAVLWFGALLFAGVVSQSDSAGAAAVIAVSLRLLVLGLHDLPRLPAAHTIV